MYETQRSSNLTLKHVNFKSSHIQDDELSLLFRRSSGSFVQIKMFQVKQSKMNTSKCPKQKYALFKWE